MPKNLTDVSDWATVAVPVDTDTADAASVETPFQLLADRAKFLLDFVMSLRLSSWFYVDHDSFTYWGGNPLQSGQSPSDICHDGQNDLFTAIDLGARTLISSDPGAFVLAGGDQPGGQGDGEWTEESDDPATCGGTGIGAGHTSAEIAAGNGKRVAVGSGYATGGVAESGAVGNWNLRSTSGSVAFHCVGFGGSLFAIGGAGGAIETSPSGITWTSRTSNIADVIRVIHHNGLAGGAALWMAMSDTEVATSVDGITWVDSTHSLGATPLRLDYDAQTDRWRAFLSTGTWAYSDNDGATWTTDPLNPFGLTASAPILKYEVGLAADGDGGWCITYERYTGTHPTIATITSKRWIMRGGESTIIPVYSPRMYGCQRGGVCFGEDRFVTAGDAGGNFSMRVLEP